MKKTCGVILGSLLLIPALGQAAENHKPINTWTCEDFLALDSSFRPTAVGFVEALNKKDKPEDAVMDVQGIDTVTPAVVQACTENKQANFKKKSESEWEKIKKAF